MTEEPAIEFSMPIETTSSADKIALHAAAEESFGKIVDAIRDVQNQLRVLQDTVETERALLHEKIESVTCTPMAGDVQEEATMSQHGKLRETIGTIKYKLVQRNYRGEIRRPIPTFHTTTLVALARIHKEWKRSSLTLTRALFVIAGHLYERSTPTSLSWLVENTGYPLTTVRQQLSLLRNNMGNSNLKLEGDDNSGWNLLTKF
ncbi:MAG: hypothetical protein PHH13_01985 [Candidatus Peribacteraceae bacterium]|nr:hypothetical protein [Candidatus Peribacteraceae bacterium]